MHEYRKVRCVIKRGGTSKGVFLHEADLPPDPGCRDRTILAIFGSPDRRQIDGLGGADPLTSKVAIIRKSTRDDADVDYTFGAVGIEAAIVDYRGNCGNLSAAVGPFAIDEGLVQPTGATTRVRIFNTNTGKILIADVRTDRGQTVYVGDSRIDGVPGTSAPIALDYSASAGSVTGKLLPTGSVVEEIAVTGVGSVRVSIIDAGNPMCFLRAEAIGLVGCEPPDDPAVLARLDLIEEIRAAAAVRIGMIDRADRARHVIPAVPMLTLVAPSCDYPSYADGRSIAKEDMSFVARQFYMQQMHKTFAGTGTVSTGAAARIQGTVVNEVMADSSARAGTVRIGHPSGVVPIEVEIAGAGSASILRKAAFNRTARRIMEGFVYVSRTAFGD